MYREGVMEGVEYRLWAGLIPEVGGAWLKLDAMLSFSPTAVIMEPTNFRAKGLTCIITLHARIFNWSDVLQMPFIEILIIVNTLIKTVLTKMIIKIGVIFQFRTALLRHTL